MLIVCDIPSSYKDKIEKFGGAVMRNWNGYMDVVFRDHVKIITNSQIYNGLYIQKTGGEYIEIPEHTYVEVTKDKEGMNKQDIGFLIDYCMKHPDVYNDVANHLHERFSVVSAEIVLLVTYYVAEERRKNK